MTLPFCLPSISVERARKLPSSEGGSVGFTVQRRGEFHLFRCGMALSAPPVLPDGFALHLYVRKRSPLRPSSIRVLYTLLGRGGLPDEFTIM